MATTIQSIIDRARTMLLETAESFWSDSELLGHAQAGVEDLWKAVLAANQKHLITSTASTISANTLTTDLPSNFGRLWGVEVSSPTTNVNLHFKKGQYFSGEFQRARFADAVAPNNHVILYDILGSGGPTASTASLRTAPKMSSDVGVTIWHIPTIDTLTTASTNPIPGHTDNALVAWVIAWARAKEREDRAPDSEYLAVYSTEKTNLINTVLEPRDAEAQEVVPALFADEWAE